jgi:hypothetical protein
MTSASDTTQLTAPLTSRAAKRSFVVWTLLGIGLLQALWVLTVPPFRGSDEFDHAYRASGIAQGQWTAFEQATDGRGLLVQADAAIVEDARAQCEALEYTGPDNCNPVRHLDDGTVMVASGAGAYSPVYYVLVGPISETMNDGSSALYAMRIAGALICLIFIGLAAWTVTLRRDALWGRVGLVIAIPPVMIYSTAIVAPNGLEMAAAVLYWCALLSVGNGLDSGTERKLIWLAACAGLVLMTDRTLGPLFALMALLTCWAIKPHLISHVLTTHRRTFTAASLLMLSGLAFAVTWFFANGAGEPPTNSSVSNGEFRWSDLLLWQFQSIAAFPFRNQMSAPVVYPIFFFAFIGLIGFAMLRGQRRERLILAAILVVVIVLPIALTAITYSGRGSMWQGRYGLPFSIGAILVAAAVLDDRGWRPRLGVPIIIIGSCAMFVATTASYSKVLEDESTRPASVTDASWLEPPMLLVIALGAVAWLALAKAMAARSDR